ncbi:MAG: carbohydrate-binding domain-containing protein, partial [Planctomycetota bacterium]
ASASIRSLQNEPNVAPSKWRAEHYCDWTRFVSGDQAERSGRAEGWGMMDNDVALIQSNTLAVNYRDSLMNAVMAISVNPVTRRVTVVGTEAHNQIRYEPNLQSHFLTVTFADFAVRGNPPIARQARINDMNPHLDVSTNTAPISERMRSVGDPRSIKWMNGSTGYVAGMGSNSVARIGRNGIPVQTPIPVGNGPTGLAIPSSISNRLFVLNRFDATISVVDTATEVQLSVVPFFDPTPASINEGRTLLYDTQQTSGLGNVACASCHIDARYDRLAWDLGNPAGEMTTNDGFTFHPMKGPMRTTSLIGIVGSPALHFRGDKSTIHDFSSTYPNLQGLEFEPSDAAMDVLESFLASIHTPPNPFRNLDNSMPTSLLIPGPRMRVGNPTATNNCSNCHDPNSNSRSGVLRQVGGNNMPGQQPTLAPSLRSMYEILGFDSQLPSKVGFAFIPDGANDTQNGATLRNDNLLAFMMAFNGDLEGDTHAAVGKQVTLNGQQTAADEDLLADLLMLADTGQIGIIAHGLRPNGRRRGFAYLGNGDFRNMVGNTVSIARVTDVSPTRPFTFTAVPAGNETRMGIDRDNDGIFDGNELPPTTIQVFVSGSTGEEEFDLVIDDNVVQAWQASTNTDAFSTTLEENVIASQIRIVFTNDLYDPDNGIDRNLTVDRIVVNGTPYQTEAPTTYSTGTYVPGSGISPGFHESEVLHSNGYFEYLSEESE